MAELVVRPSIRTPPNGELSGREYVNNTSKSLMTFITRLHSMLRRFPLRRRTRPVGASWVSRGVSPGKHKRLTLMIELVAAPIETLFTKTTNLMSMTGHGRTLPTETPAPFWKYRSRRGWGRSGSSCTKMACSGAEGQPIVWASHVKSRRATLTASTGVYLPLRTSGSTSAWWGILERPLQSPPKFSGGGILHFGGGRRRYVDRKSVV